MKGEYSFPSIECPTQEGIRVVDEQVDHDLVDNSLGGLR